MTWINPPNNIEDYEGFIYKITHIETGKFYIGKKCFWNNIKLKPLKGRKNRRNRRKESDWRQYFGSSKELLLDKEKYGQNAFKCEILQLCGSKWQMAYYEAKYQFDQEVIFLKNSYNGILNLRVPKAPKNLQK